MKKVRFILTFIIIFLAAVLADTSNAAPCSTGGAVTIAISCEINGVANYTDLTITGGAKVTSAVGNKIEIIAIGKVQIDAGSGIDVSEKGNSVAGKGVDGTTNGSACKGAFGSGGGGGGYGGVGGMGGTDATAIGGAGGVIYGSIANPSDLGSQGGLGGGNSTGAGMGGGAVKITAGNIILNGHIRANGGNGSDPRGNDGSGAGGGGSGGSIWLLASNSFNFTGGILEARGGNGGTDGNCVGWDGAGGGGGGGRISLQYKGPKIGIGTHNESFGLGGGGPEPGANGANGTFYEDPCFQKACGDYCGGLTAHREGTCDSNTGNCNYIEEQNCADADECTVDGCDKGICSNINACGGLVPCGRKYDDPSTLALDESKPCQLCHLFVMFDGIIDFLLVYILFPVAVLMLVIAGALYVGAVFEVLPGGFQTLTKAKGIIFSVALGLIIIFSAFLLVGFFLKFIGLAETTNFYTIYKDWWTQGLFKVNCQIK